VSLGALTLTAKVSEKIEEDGGTKETHKETNHKENGEAEPSSTLPGRRYPRTRWLHAGSDRKEEMEGRERKRQGEPKEN